VPIVSKWSWHLIGGCGRGRLQYSFRVVVVVVVVVKTNVTTKLIVRVKHQFYVLVAIVKTSAFLRH
jgi:hypothetical protein